MKCGILIAVKSYSIPIQECGGVVLADGDKLLVDESISARVLTQYAGYLVQVDTCEQPSLSGGHYEYLPSGNKAAAEAPTPMVEVVADRSMFGRNKQRRK